MRCNAISEGWLSPFVLLFNTLKGKEAEALERGFVAAPPALLCAPHHLSLTPADILQRDARSKLCPTPLQISFTSNIFTVLYRDFAFPPRGWKPDDDVAISLGL